MIFRFSKRQFRRQATIPLDTLRDTRLTAQARSLLVYLLSQDESYRVDYPRLCAEFDVAPRALRRWFNELIDHGYVIREVHADTLEAGRFFWTFKVYALPHHIYLHAWREAKARERQAELRRQEKVTIEVSEELWGSKR